jgi:nitroreductase
MDIFESVTVCESFKPVFTEQKISREDIRRVLKTASLAPSPYNCQPWEFVVVQQTEHIQQITSIAADMIDSSDAGLSRDQIKDYLLGLNNLLVYLEDTTRQDPGENAYKLGLISMGTALGNLILAASAMGIAIQPITFKSNEQLYKLKDYLKIPDQLEIRSLIALGYLKDFNRDGKSPPLVIHDNYYGNQREIGKLENIPSTDDCFSLIKKRKSYRKNYLAREVKKESEDSIIKAARDSLFLHHRRAWELILIKDKKLINTLAALITEVSYKIHMDKGYSKKMRAWMRFTRDEKTRTADGVLIVLWSNFLGHILKAVTYCMERFAVFRPIRALFVKKHSLEFFGNLVCQAPLLIVMLSNEKQRENSGLSYELNTMSIGVGIQNILLAATAQEMGAQFLSILVDEENSRERLKKLLRLPDDAEIVDLMRVGYIDLKAPEPVLSVDNTLRRPVEKIAHKEFYQEFYGIPG